MKLSRAGRDASGFTLVEMLVVTAILSMLALVVLPTAEIAHARQKERTLRDALKEIRTAIDAYKRISDEAASITGRSGYGYPPSLNVLVSGYPDPRPGSEGRNVYLLRRLPRDPFAPEGVPPHESWGLRSYESPPESPRPGADVYDVYSLSQRMGSNGIALSQW